MTIKLPWTRWLERGILSAAPAIASEAILRATPEILQRAKIEVVQDVARAMVQPGSNVIPGSYPAKGGSPYPVYGYDHPITFATPLSPQRRPETLITMDTIERFAASYDILRSCINHLKREVQSQPFNISPIDSSDKSTGTQKRIQLASQFFSKRGGLGEVNETRRHFEAKINEDILVVGAFAAYKEKSRAGKLLKVLPIAAKTIRPLMDAYGWPGPGEAWYQQWIMGMVVAEFAPDEMTYDGMWPETNSPWFISPVEWLISTTLSALKSDEWNRAWLTDGNTPGSTITCPPEWTPDQIIQYAEYFNEMLAGNSAARNTSVFLPGGVKASDHHSRKDQDFKEFELWLARRTGAILGVHLAAIGFSGEQYKVTQDGSMDATTQFGASALLDIRKEFYDDVLIDLGYEDLEVTNIGAASESPLERATRIAVQLPWMKLSEARTESGLDPDEECDVILVSNLLVPLETALKPPEPDPADAAAADGKTASAAGDDEPADVNRWMRKALKRFKEGKQGNFSFSSSTISEPRQQLIRAGLASAKTESAIRLLFRAKAEEGDEDEAAKRKKRLVAMLLFHMDQGADSVDSAAMDLLAGSIEMPTFVSQSMSALETEHIEAAWLGRLRAGGTGGISDADRALGISQAETQRPFLFKFAADITSNLQSEAQIENRANMYGQRLVGTANKSWALNVASDEIDWIDTGDSGECEDCEGLAAGGPYTSETLPSTPGDGSTACNTACRCYLETSDGLRSFYNPEEGSMDTRKAA